MKISICLVSDGHLNSFFLSCSYRNMTTENNAKRISNAIGFFFQMLDSQCGQTDIFFSIELISFCVLNWQRIKKIQQSGITSCCCFPLHNRANVKHFNMLMNVFFFKSKHKHARTCTNKLMAFSSIMNC